MPSKHKDKSDRAPDHIGNQLLTALTQGEISQLLDALFRALSTDLREQVLGQLQPDTREAVQQLFAPPQTTDQPQAAQPVSLAKLQQTWSELWREWDGMVEEAVQEDGTYMAQEAHWEPPYFDGTAFIDDLERVAAKMQPLLQIAFENEFAPDAGFAQELLQAEEAISSAMPEWMAALRELAPHAYDALSEQWRVAHKRRRNLWKALEQAGLG